MARIFGSVFPAAQPWICHVDRRSGEDHLELTFRDDQSGVTIHQLDPRTAVELGHLLVSEGEALERRQAAPTAVPQTWA